jgi:hypothetical protein
LAAFEVVWIFLIFFLFAGSAPPDVGESHYLTKARHYWQPQWCAGDLFLDSRDAHGVFYWTFGWVTRFCSLEATAWIGRAVTWLLLAWSWQRLSWAMVPRALASLLSAGLMLLFLRNMHLAGEWVVGGVEAKGFAYVLVFLALEAIVRNRWQASLLLAGAAGAFHVLVGGWTAIAIGLAWLVTRNRPRLVSLLPAAAGGLVLALPGLIGAIALNWGVPKEIAREAARIYVFDRLSHHLVFHSLAPSFITRFQVLLVLWVCLTWLLRGEQPLLRLQKVVAGAVVIGLAGVVIDQWYVFVGRSSEQWRAELAAAQLLRYYWMRMSDSLVPVGVSLGIMAGLAKIHSSRPNLAFWLSVAACVAAALNLADIGYTRSVQERLPPAIRQSRPTNDSSIEARLWFRDWQAVCRWVAENAPPDAVFLTPREQQTFKWYAGRAEVANWKDVPQDARGLIAWKQRIDDIYPRSHRNDLAEFSDVELVALAHKYGAGFIVLDKTRSQRRLGLRRLYPRFREDNPSFEVYQLPGIAQP